MTIVKYYVLAFMLGGEFLPIDDFKTLEECRMARTDEQYQTPSIKVVCLEKTTEIMK